MRLVYSSGKMPDFYSKESATMDAELILNTVMEEMRSKGRLPALNENVLDIHD